MGYEIINDRAIPNRVILPRIKYTSSEPIRTPIDVFSKACNRSLGLPAGINYSFEIITHSVLGMSPKYSEPQVVE